MCRLRLMWSIFRKKSWFKEPHWFMASEFHWQMIQLLVPNIQNLLCVLFISKRVRAFSVHLMAAPSMDQALNCSGLVRIKHTHTHTHVVINVPKLFFSLSINNEPQTFDGVWKARSFETDKIQCSSQCDLVSVFGFYRLFGVGRWWITNWLSPEMPRTICACKDLKENWASLLSNEHNRSKLLTKARFSVIRIKL